MSTQKLPRIAVLVTALLVSLASVIAVAAAADPDWSSFPGNSGKNKTVLIEVDVSEDMYRFVFDQDVVHDDGMPAFGTAFITQGYIYPQGTLDGSESGGVLEDGSPEFPELVLGEWTCYGYFVGDGAHSETGPMVITTQTFNFGDEFGGQSVVTSGYELVDVGVPVKRAVTGGTGDYATARGEATQQFLGLNASEGVVLTHSLEITTK